MMRRNRLSPPSKQGGFFLNPFRFGAAAGPTPPLDPYTTSMWGAYGLKQLLTAYSGNLLKIRRSSDNAELDIGQVLGVLDWASLLAFVGAGSGYVTTWYDQSGSGRNLTQATASLQPMLVDTGVARREIIWDGVNDWMGTAASMTSNTDLTIYLSGRIHHNIYGTDGTNQTLFQMSGFAVHARREFGRGDGNTGPINTGAYTIGINTKSDRIGSVYAWGADLDSALQSFDEVRGYTDGNDDSYRYASGTAPGNFGGVGVWTIGCASGGSSYCRLKADKIVIYDGVRHSQPTIATISELLKFRETLDVFDYYNTNLWGLYGFRRMRSTYSGALMRVRRSSDSTELDIGQVDGYLDTASLMTFVGAGDGFVVTLYDQSGGAHDFTQATTTKQPRVVISGVYQWKVIFDGTSDVLLTGNSNTPTAFTVMMSGGCQPDDATTVGHYLSHGPYGTAAGIAWIYNLDRRTYLGISSAGGTGTGYVQNTWLTNLGNSSQTVRYDRTVATASLKVEFFTGGIKVAASTLGSAGTAPSGNFAAAPWTLGGLTSSSYLKMEFIALAIFEGSLSDANIAYLSRDFG